MLSCSVLIPVYNGVHTVLAAIESASAQGSAVSEIVVVDNCSDDGTWEALQALRLPRLRLLRNSHNLGLFGNFNRCLEEARADILLFLCADDRLSPDALRSCLTTFAAYPDIALMNARGSAVATSGQVIKSLGSTVVPGVYPGRQAVEQLLLFHSQTGMNPLNYPGGVLLRRSAVRDLRFDEGMKRLGDIDLFYRVLARGRFAQVETSLCLITFHEQQEGKKRREEPIEPLEFERIVDKLSFEPAFALQLLTNFRALALWRALLLGAEGRLRGFGLHARFAYQRLGKVRVSLVFLAFVGRRIRLYVLSPMLRLTP